MKRLAARDFEDLLQVSTIKLLSLFFPLYDLMHLQCALPVFDRLLPEPHNTIVLDLLFDLAAWHGYAKLHMHTEDTLGFFDTATAVLGQMVRKFIRATCEYYYTTELPQEYAARGRRDAALASKQPASSNLKGKAISSGPKRKTLNLSTYKYHALGDYPNTIRQFGTTDNYTTQPVRVYYFHHSFTNFAYRENYSTGARSDGSRRPQKVRKIRSQV